jgi:hypothetical protein
MSATITSLPSGSAQSDEVGILTDRKVLCLQSLEAGPGRDSFVAQTAVKLDQLQASVRIITRNVEQLAAKVVEMQDACAFARWNALEQSEKHSRDSKLQETLRCCRELKARVDRIEGRTGGDYHAYTSFEAISRKLAELERRATDERPIRKDVPRCSRLLSGALVATVAIFGLQVFLS